MALKTTEKPIPNDQYYDYRQTQPAARGIDGIISDLNDDLKYARKYTRKRQLKDEILFHQGIRHSISELKELKAVK